MVRCMVYEIWQECVRQRVTTTQQSVANTLLTLRVGCRNNVGKLRFYEGMRLHACARASGKGSARYLPGRVVAVHRNGTVDVECEGGVVKNGITQEDVLVGLQEGQEVEARRPVLVRMQCTGVSWSCNGSVLAASFGNRDVSGWCDSPGWFPMASAFPLLALI